MRRSAVVVITGCLAVAVGACGSSGSSATNYNPAVHLGSHPQFEIAAGPQLGLNGVNPAGATVLDGVGQQICFDVQSGKTPDGIVSDIETELRNGGDVAVTDSGVSGAMADAVLYVCPDLRSKLDAESGAG